MAELCVEGFGVKLIAEIGDVAFAKGTTARDAGGAAYDYSGVKSLGADKLAVSYAKPESVSAGDAMTILAANATLKDISASAATTTAYEFTTKGVTVNGEITGSAAAKNGAVDFTVTANQATNLTFGEVDWMASGAWIDHATTLTNISFDGADVDTAKISFTNVNKLDDGAKMTLVSAFGTKAGIITGSAYTLGDLSGEGHAYFENNDLLYLVTKGVGGDTPEPENGEQ